MGISLGSGKSSNSSTSNTNQTQTYTPTNPSWVEPQISGLASQISGLAGQNPQSFFAGPSQLQTQAAGTAGTLGPINTSMAHGLGTLGGAESVYGDAATAAGQGGYGYNPAGIAADKMPTMEAATASPYIDRYMDPYLNDVVGSSLADYDVGAGQTRAQNQLALAGDDTFSGSGGAIQTALSNDAITRGRAALSSGLRSQGFSTALGAAQSDAERAQQANEVNTTNAFNRLASNQAANNNAWQFNAGQAESAAQRQLAAGQGLAGLGTDIVNAGAAQDANTRANAGTQSDIGSVLQQIQQNLAGAPVSVVQSLVSALGGLPLDLLHGQVANTVGTTSTKGSGSQTSFGIGLGK